MNNPFIFCALIAFVGVSTLGFTAMSHNMEGGHSVCFAMIGAALCPQELNLLDSLAMHLNSLDVIYSAVFASAFTLLALALAWLIFLYFLSLNPSLRHQPHQIPVDAESISLGNVSFLKWLSFKEHSPTFS